MKSFALNSARGAIGMGILLLAGCITTTPENPGSAQAVQNVVDEVTVIVDSIKEGQIALREQVEALKVTDDRNDQELADRVYGARYANTENPQQNPHTEVVEKELEAAGSLLLAEPTQEAREDIIRRLRIALTGTQESMAELETEYARLRAEYAQLAEAKNKLEENLSQTATSLEARESELGEKVEQLESIEAEVEIAAAATENERQAKRKERASKYRVMVASAFMGLGGLLAVAGIVGGFLGARAITAPAIVGGGSLLLIGWFITYLEDLMLKQWFQVTVGVIGLCVFVGIGFWIYKKTKERRHEAKFSDTISTNLIGATQEMRNDDARFGTNQWAGLKKYIEEWNVDDNGNPDVEVDREIKKRLVGLNLVNPDRKGVRESIPTKMKDVQPDPTENN